MEKLKMIKSRSKHNQKDIKCPQTGKSEIKNIHNATKGSKRPTKNRNDAIRKSIIPTNIDAKKNIQNTNRNT